jgi:SulP family sulfate permease
MLAFSKIRTYCDRNGCRLILTRMNKQIAAQFTQAGLDPQYSRIRTFADLDTALEYCEEEVLADAAASLSTAQTSIWDRIGKVLPEGTPLSAFMAYLEPRSYKAGEYLVKQGGAPDEILFIESGRVTISISLPDGRSMRLRSMTVGTMIGEIGMYLKQPRIASAVADLQTKAWVLSAEKLREMEARDPQLANALHYAIVSLLAERLTATNGLLQRLID